MKAKEMRSRSDEELQRLEDELADDLFRKRMANATHQLDNTSLIRRIRRDLARIETVKRQRALGISLGSEAGGEEE